MEVRYLERSKTRSEFFSLVHTRSYYRQQGGRKFETNPKKSATSSLRAQRVPPPPFWKGKRGSSARAVTRKAYHFTTDATMSNFILLEELPRAENDLLPQTS